MSRVKIGDESKATPDSVSLLPKHYPMIEFLIKKLKTQSKSRTIQRLIEDKFYELKESKDE
jgi:hypothetical protein